MVRKKYKDEIAVLVPGGVSCDETVCTLPADIQNDEYRGMGGSYVIDPATGKRIRVEGPDVGADSIRPELEPETGINHEEIADESE